MNGEQLLSMDPTIVLSIVNMKLRDQYSSLPDLCEDLDIERNHLEKKLKNEGYTYNEINNQFILM